MANLNLRHEWLVTQACRLYRLLLHSYPAPFRREYGVAMVTLFRDRLREVFHEKRSLAGTRRGDTALIRFAGYALRDWFSTTLYERTTAMNRAALFTSVAALAAGLYTAYVDFHATEVAATLLVIVITTFALGILYGRLGWLWALIVAGCLTGAHLIAPHFGISPRDGGNIGNPLSLMIVALPAAASAYLGAGVRRVARLSRS